MKSATNDMSRPVIELLRRADLLHHAVAQHDDPVGERQRLVLVVRDVDRGRAERVVDAADLGPHLEAQLGVEVRQRLVHQDERRLDDDGARDGDALLLAAGELARQLARSCPAAARGRALARPRSGSRPRAGAASQAEADVRRTRSCAERARSSGTPCRSRASPAAAGRCARRRARCSPPVAGSRPASSSARWTCRSRTGRAGR